MRYAVVHNDTVENVIEAPQGFALAGRALIVLPAESPVGPGWRRVAGVFEPPVPDDPPPTLLPSEFVALLSAAQIVAAQSSSDPHLIVLKSRLQTINAPMPFAPGSELYRAVEYLGLVLPSLFPPSEVTRILAREAPQ